MSQPSFDLFPADLVDDLVPFLSPSDLRSLAFTCKTFHKFFYQTYLRHFYYQVGTYYFNGRYIDRKRRPVHSFFTFIASRPHFAQLVIKLDTYDHLRSGGEKRSLNAERRPSEISQYFEEYKQLVSLCPWVYEAERDDVVASICSGNEFGVLAVGLHLLENIDHIRLPATEEYWLNTVWTRMASAQIDIRSGRLQGPLAARTMSKLAFLDFLPEHNEWGPDLEDMETFITLPSLKVVNAAHVYNGDVDLGRPKLEGLLPSNVEKFYFWSSSLSRAEISAYMSRMVVPCEAYSLPPYYGYDNCSRQWGSCRVRGIVDPQSRTFIPGTRWQEIDDGEFNMSGLEARAMFFRLPDRWQLLNLKI